jgi:hypothetical protein
MEPTNTEIPVKDVVPLDQITGGDEEDRQLLLEMAFDAPAFGKLTSATATEEWRQSSSSASSLRARMWTNGYGRFPATFRQHT